MVYKGVSGFSEGQEEFLELLYRLTASGGLARTSDLAKGLRSSLGTVTNLVERLERKGLVVHQPYRGVTLTPKGKRIAAEIVRRHRLVERFLTDFLMIPSERAHKYACKMEHAVDEEVVNALATLLSST
jgi:DtxR family Mn-dependent transcriptional regulator